MACYNHVMVRKVSTDRIDGEFSVTATYETADSRSVDSWTVDSVSISGGVGVDSDGITVFEKEPAGISVSIEERGEVETYEEAELSFDSGGV